MGGVELAWTSAEGAPVDLYLHSVGSHVYENKGVRAYKWIVVLLGC